MIDRNQHLVATLCISAAFFSSGLYAQTAKPKKEVSTEEALINAAVKPAPDRKAGEGMGPYDRLIICGITVIDGTGAAPQRPDGRGGRAQ